MSYMAYKSDSRSFRITPEAQAALDKVIAETGMSLSTAVNNALVGYYANQTLTYYVPVMSASASSDLASAKQIAAISHSASWPPPRRRKPS